MHSSTSNSDSPPQWPETYWQRPIPTAHWRAVGLMTVLIVCLFFAGWEAYWRSQDYGPSFENTADMWAKERAKVGSNGKDETVIVGASRILFDLDLDMWQQEFPGPRPIELAVVGTCPLPVLHDIADDESFTGTVLCGVTEVIFFLPPDAPPSVEVAEFVEHYHNWSPASRWGLYLSVPFESAFASLNLEDLSLNALLNRWIPAENRPGTRVYPKLPPYFASMDWDRRNKMWARTETDPEHQKQVQSVWMPLMKEAPPALPEELVGFLMGSIAADVAKIQSRGGRVVFIRFPSTDIFLDLEREFRPRELYWDRLLKETGAPGIHFEDYPELSGFDCPEWSHLTRSDSVLFTHGLAKIYREMIRE